MENVRGLERGRREITSISLPGFEDFLKVVRDPSKLSSGYMAQSSVSITDILIDIVSNNTIPVLIPTAEGFYSRTTALKDSLLETRTKYNLGIPK